MPDTFTTVLDLTKVEEFASDDTWGGKLNDNWDAIDDLFQDVSGTPALKIANGGTGAITAATARTALGAAASGVATGSGLIINTDRLAGRDTASSGALEEISVSGGLEFTGSGGIQRSALTGDVTAAAGSNAMVIANNAITTLKILNDAVTYAKIQNVSATSRVLGRKTAGAGDIEELTLSEILDFIGSAAWGDILFRGTAGWQRLPAGTSGQYLKTNGAGADPSWATIASPSQVTKLVDNVSIGTGANYTINNSIITQAYKKFELMYVNVSHNSGSAADLRLEISGDNGSSWTTALVLDNGAAADFEQGHIEILMADITSGQRLISDSGGTNNFNVTTGYINAIRLSISGGVFDSGVVTLLGYT